MDGVRVIGIPLKTDETDDAVTVEITVCIVRTEVLTDRSSLNPADVFDVMIDIETVRMIRKKSDQFLMGWSDASPKEDHGDSSRFKGIQQFLCSREGSIFTGLDADEVSTGSGSVHDLIELRPETAVGIHDLLMFITLSKCSFQTDTDLGRKRVCQIREEKHNMMLLRSVRSSWRKKKEYKKKSDEPFRRMTSFVTGTICSQICYINHTQKTVYLQPDDANIPFNISEELTGCAGECSAQS